MQQIKNSRLYDVKIKFKWMGVLLIRSSKRTIQIEMREEGILTVLKAFQMDPQKEKHGIKKSCALFQWSNDRSIVNEHIHVQYQK